MKPGSPDEERRAPAGVRKTLNYQYNEVEELAGDPRATAERHFELFRERSRFTGRLFTLTLLAAAVVLLKVLMPFQELSETYGERTRDLASVTDRATELDQRIEVLGRVEKRCEKVQRTIRHASWSHSVEELVGTMRQLNRSYRVLLDTSNEELQRVLDAEANGPAQVGALLGDAAPLPAAYQATRSDWKSPPLPPQESEPAATEPESESPTLGAEQLEALRDYFAALERVREMGLVDEAADVPAPEDAEPAPDERDMVQTPAWMNEPPPSLDEAIATLHADPRQLLGFATFRERDEFLFDLLQTRAREEANATLATISDEVSRTVVDPIGRTLEDVGQEDLSILKGGFEELQASLDVWKDRHESDSSWYQTVAAKGQAVNDLGRTLGNILASATETLENQSAAVTRERASAADRARDLAEERRELRESRDGIQAELEGLMPSWTAGFVDTSELIQVFPLLLVMMVFVLVYNVWLVRDHFLLSRTPGHDRAPYTSASLWTLVHRGGFRTLTSLAVYLGGATLLWFAYEQGTILTGRWAALEGAHPWAFTTRVLEAGPWIGRAVFLGAAGGIILALLSREQPVEQPDYV